MYMLIMYFLAALAASTYLTEMREKIFNVLYKAINCPSTELQKAGKEGMSKVHVVAYW